MKKRLVGGLVVASTFLMLAFAGGAQALPVFVDDFNSENDGVYQLNYNHFDHWTVTFGTVDLIGNGDYDFLPGNGLYVDLDGSSSNAGVMTSNKITVNEGTYQLSIDFAGSQRGSLENVELAVDLLSVGGVPLISDVFSLAASSGFTRHTWNFTSTGGPVDLQILVNNQGGDNIGALMDNVQLSNVPEPGTMLLLGSGLLGLGLMRRRKQATK